MRGLLIGENGCLGLSTPITQAGTATLNVHHLSLSSDDPLLIEYVLGTAKNAEVEETLKSRDEIFQLLHSNLVLAQNRMKQLYDCHRMDREFSLGDLVYVKLHPCRQLSGRIAKHTKLSPRYFGPYKVLERIGKVAYRVELPKDCCIHNVFHVSLLNEKWGRVDVQGSELPLVTATNHLLLQYWIAGQKSRTTKFWLVGLDFHIRVLPGNQLILFLVFSLWRRKNSWERD